MTDTNITNYITVYRQQCDEALTGVAPIITVGEGEEAEDIAAVPQKYEDGRYTYCLPTDETEDTITDGGLFIFEQSRPVFLLEIRNYGGALSAWVMDRAVASGSVQIANAVAAGGRTTFDPPLPVMSFQQIKATLADPGENKGVVELYVASGASLG